MEDEIKEKLKLCGLKQNYIAKKIGISQNYLSMCLTGKRNLSKEKLTKLKELL